MQEDTDYGRRGRFIIPKKGDMSFNEETVVLSVLGHFDGSGNGGTVMLTSLTSKCVFLFTFY